MPAAGTLAGLLVVILLTTPLQAAGEEVGFRGYLTQAVASWSVRPVSGIVVGHRGERRLLRAGPRRPGRRALFGDRLAFGLTASWLVWRTGGLEASMALHAANNLVSLVVHGLHRFAGGRAGTRRWAGATLCWTFADDGRRAAAVLALAWLAAIAVARRVALPTDRGSCFVRSRRRFGYPGARSVHPAASGARDTLGVWGNWQPD